MIWGLNGLIYLANICQFLFEELDKKKGSIAFVKTENTLAITVDSFCQWSEAVLACHRETTRLYYGCRRSITAWVFGMASTNNNNTKVGNVVMYLLIFSTFLLAIVLKDQNLYGLTSVAATSIKRYMRHRTVTLCGKKLKSLLYLERRLTINLSNYMEFRYQGATASTSKVLMLNLHHLKMGKEYIY
jgi:hypothetical protein